MECTPSACQDGGRVEIVRKGQTMNTIIHDLLASESALARELGSAEQRQNEPVREILKEIDRLSCNAPCMSREVQAHFERNPAADSYRVELNTLILAMREQARKALAITR